MVIIYIEEESYATEIGKIIKDTHCKEISLNSLYENLKIHFLSNIKVIIKYLMRK